MARVHSIFISSRVGGGLEQRNSVKAVQFCGLEGDRYYRQHDTAPGNPNAVTLIDLEQVYQCNSILQTSFSPQDFRRNIITAETDLNSLVGRDFCVGSVTLRGFELCEPCRYISELLHADLLAGMARRGGLRAWIISGGTIEVDDLIAEQP